MGKNFRETLNEQMKDPEFRAEWEAQEPERQIMHAILEGRQNCNLTQEQLAQVTGINQANISRLENGTANPSLRTLKRLAEGMGMELKLIPGGPDVNPKRWGDDRPYDPTLCCEIRDSFEFKLVDEVLRAKKPLFTTCRGTQLLNVATGGTLCMDVPSLGAREGRTQWRHTHVLNDPVHPVEVVPGSLLERAVGGHRLIQTNSAHHCCVDRLGKSTRLVAKATDGVPECIEVEGQPFCLGVQWHPEYTWKTLETDFDLWKSFVEAAAKVKRAR